MKICRACDHNRLKEAEIVNVNWEERQYDDNGNHR